MNIALQRIAGDPAATTDLNRHTPRRERRAGAAERNAQAEAHLIRRNEIGGADRPANASMHHAVDWPFHGVETN